MRKEDRFDLIKDMPAGMEALVAVENVLAATDFGAGLKHLVKLRVSQINGCAYCVAMHNREARHDGEVQDRLDNLVVWRHVTDFTQAERAALAWAEAMTTRGTGESLDDLHGELAMHFDAEGVATLSLVVVMINTWNRLQIAAHNAKF